MALVRILAAAALVCSSALLYSSGGATAATTYYCFGQPATIVGTPGDDVLYGSGQTADVIVGLGGNDSIVGFDPSTEDIYEGSPLMGDRLCGGPGSDRIGGAMGEDRIQGGAGADRIEGSFGYDVILQGGGGNDSVSDCDSEYTGGARTISGGAGDDRLCIDVDPARMYGDGGNDVLIDLDCIDAHLLAGGPGNDQLESYVQNSEGMNCSEYGDTGDRVNGGDGTDSARVSPADTVTETESVLRE
jgi:Ca2+-binding RTX toxin-like protein